MKNGQQWLWHGSGMAAPSFSISITRANRRAIASLRLLPQAGFPTLRLLSRGCQPAPDSPSPHPAALAHEQLHVPHADNCRPNACSSPGSVWRHCKAIVAGAL